jgi:AbiV family abortive infection protein
MSSLITFNELDEGIEKSVENASRYLADALFLFKHKKYQSSILLSMFSYEESGKALLLMNHKLDKKEITKTQWTKRFCSHTVKNIFSRRAIWQDIGFTPPFPNHDKTLARFDQEWKHVFTYVDYDFRNQKWTTPLTPKGFGIENAQSFCINAMSHAREALESLIKRLNKSRL